jgi:hypothetical protein
MRQKLLTNPMYLEVATYVFAVLVAAGLTLSHWAAPLIAVAQQVPSTTL